MNEKTEDKFEMGIFWELYKDLERQFENFLEYVPYLEQNENTCSFKLLHLLLSVGGHVDSAFKEMARCPSFHANRYCKKIFEKLKQSEENVMKGEPPIPISIKLSLKAFEEEYKLSRRKVIFKRVPENKEVTPFKPYNPRTSAPMWWDVYNRLKHDVSLKIKEANLQTALNALAGAFILNVNHSPAVVWLLESGFLKVSLRGVGRVGKFVTTKERLITFIKDRQMMTVGYAETPLFIYDYSQNK